MRWTGHVARMTDETCTQYLVGKPELKRPHRHGVLILGWALGK